MIPDKRSGGEKSRMEITSAFDCNPNSGCNHEMSAHKDGQADHGSKRDGKEP